MAGLTKIESFLMDLDISYQELGTNAYYIDDPDKGLPGISVSLSEPIVVFRAKVMTLPQEKKPELLEQLLRLNGTDIVHGAYGLDDSDVVLIDTLEYDTMDKGEFQATLDSMGLALSRHYAILRSYRN